MRSNERQAGLDSPLVSLTHPGARGVQWEAELPPPPGIDKVE